MTNTQVIQKFLQGQKGATPKRQILNNYYYYEGRTLATDGQILTNYKTDIAEKDNDTISILIDYFSNTTSKIQKELLRTAIKKGYNIILKQNDTSDTKRLADFTKEIRGVKLWRT